MAKVQLRNLHEYVVVAPRVNEKVPSDEAFSLLLKDKRVILLLDDLTRYVDVEVDLREFWEKLGHHTTSRVFAATCRDGPELSAVRDAQKQSLRWFYDSIPLKLSLREASSDEKRWLADKIGKTREERDWEEFRELGHVVMEYPMNQMRGRFERLSHQSTEQRDALRALKLLSVAGVLPFTRSRLVAVMGSLFERSSAHLGDCLDALAEQSFLRSGEHGLVEPEAAYLRYVVDYSPGKKPEDDFPKLADVLEGIVDTEGLFYLGSTYAVDLGNHEEARRCFDRAVRLRPGDSKVWRDKGAELRAWLEHLSDSHTPEEVSDVIEEALSAYEEAIRLEADFAGAWRGKGAVLMFITKYQEAIDAFDEAIKLKPDYHDAWCDKGMALVSSEHYQEAVDASEEAIRLDSSCPQAWINKGRALFMMGSLQKERERSREASELFDKAVEAFEEATNLSPNVFGAWMDLGKVFVDLERYEEALQAFHEATAIRPDDHEAWEWKGRPLIELKQYDEYEKATEKALRLDPDCHLAWENRGFALYHLGRPWVEVEQYYDQAISLRPNDPDVWAAKANSADASGWSEAAVDLFDKAISLKPDFPKAWMGKGAALTSLERYQEALEAINKAISLRPDDPQSWEYKGRLLRRMGEHKAAKEAFGKALSLDPG
jgi:tetratricopeptide (TPR) repeat protein